MKKLIIALLILGAGLLGFQVQAQASNLLADPGFENGGSAIVLRDGPWTWSGGSNGDAFYDPNVARSGSKSAKTVMWGAGGGDYAYYVEEFTGLDWTVPYNMSGYFMRNSAYPLQPNATAMFEVKWMNALGNLIRIDTSPEFNNSYAIDQWHSIAFTTPTPPTGTAKVAVVGVILSNQAYSSESAMFTDDLHFGVIPEPGSILMLGTGLVGLLGFVRRKR